MHAQEPRRPTVRHRSMHSFHQLFDGSDPRRLRATSGLIRHSAGELPAVGRCGPPSRAFPCTKQTKVPNRLRLSQKIPNETKRLPDCRLAERQVERACPTGLCWLSENTCGPLNGYRLSELTRPFPYMYYYLVRQATSFLHGGLTGPTPWPERPPDTAPQLSQRQANPTSNPGRSSE